MNFRENTLHYIYLRDKRFLIEREEAYLRARGRDIYIYSQGSRVYPSPLPFANSHLVDNREYVSETERFENKNS